MKGRPPTSPHGPSWIEKFKILTGELVAEGQRSNYLLMTPMWAWGWGDEFGDPYDEKEEPPAEKKPAAEKPAAEKKAAPRR